MVKVNCMNSVKSQHVTPKKECREYKTYFATSVKLTWHNEQHVLLIR